MLDQRLADHRHLRTCVKAAGGSRHRWQNDRFYAEPLKLGLITSHNRFEREIESCELTTVREKRTQKAK